MDDLEYLILRFGDHLSQNLHYRDGSDQHTVQRGLFLYRQNRVRSLRLSDDILYATVQDVVPAQVELDLYLEHGSCTCPEKRICKHQMAAFFAVYGRFFPVSEWLETWRDRSEQEQLSLGIFSSASPKKGPVAEPKGKGSRKEILESTAREAAKSFVQSVVSEKNDMSSLFFQIYADMAIQKIDDSLSSDWEMTPVEMVFACTVFLQGVFEELEKVPDLSSETAENFLDLFDVFVGNIENAIARMPRPLPFKAEPLLNRLASISGKFLEREEPFFTVRLYLYWKIWADLLKDISRRKKEFDRLSRLFKKGGENELLAQAFLCHFFLAGRMKETLTALNASDDGYYFLHHIFLSYSLDNGDLRTAEKILASILHILPGVIENRSPDEIRRFHSWLEGKLFSYAEESGDYDLAEKLFSGLFPHSARSLIRLFLKTEQYGKLSDLLLAAGYGVDNIEGKLLKEISRKDPESLLAIYHWSILREIEAKNRNHYRKAVSHLKKLKAIYKKLKREEEWNRYFDRLLKQFRRLSAFREECKRGKLIHEA